MLHFFSFAGNACQAAALRCDAQTMAAHEPMDHLEFRARSPLAKAGIQKQSEAPGRTLTGTHRKSERSCRHRQPRR